MPGLGIGLGLNKRQQNRFAAAAQQPGGGSAWLAQHPGVQKKIGRVDPNSQQATNIGNFVGAGQTAPGAAQRFQPPPPTPGPMPVAPGTQLSTGQAPQGSGATGSNKPSGGGGGGGAPGGGSSMGGQLSGQLGPGTPQQAPPSGGGLLSYMAGGQQGGSQQPQQGGYNPPWGQPGSQQWNNYLQQQDAQEKAWMAAHPGASLSQTQGPASLGYKPGYTWQGSGYGPPPGQQTTGTPGPGNMGQLLGQLGAGQPGNQAGMASQQTQLQNQQRQQLLQQILQAFGGGQGF